MRERSRAFRRRIPDLVKESTPKQNFNELILAIHSMNEAITTMQWQMNRHMGVHEEHER